MKTTIIIKQKPSTIIIKTPQLMAKVSFEYPVRDVCGKVGKTSAVGFAHRGETKFTVRYGKRTSLPTEGELSQRAKFKTVVNATRARLQNPAESAKDQAAFQQQNKYKTLYQYVFNQEWQKAA